MGIKAIGVVRNLILVFAVTFLSAAAANAGTSSVNAGVTHQVIRGFGASNAWSDCGSCTPGSAKNAWFTPANLDMLFSTSGNGIGLSIIRMRIPPDSSQFGSAIAPVQGAAARGAIVMATEWTPPPQWKSANTTANSNGEYLLPANYQNYANYLRDFVNTMKNTYNVNIYALCGSNEPDYKVSYDGCSWDGTQELNFIKNYLGPTFATAGLATKIIVGESYANNFAITDPTLNDPVAANYVSIAAVHTYGGGPSAYPLAVSKGKEYWMTEMANFQPYESDMTGTNGGGLVWAGRIHTGLVNSEYNAWIYWWLSSDASNEGLTHPTLGNPKRFYVMGNYSKFIRPGFIRIDASQPGSGVTCSAYKEPSGTGYVIVAINTGAAVNTTFNLTGISAASFTPHITSSSLNLAAQAAVTVSGSSFTYTLPAQSVVSFVASGPPATATHTPNPAWSKTFTPTASPTPYGVMLDTMEDGDNANNWGGNWYSYSGTGTTITPKPFNMTAGGMTGSANYRASIIATVADYAGMGTNLNAAETAVDMTNYTSVEFYVKGNGGSYWFQFTQPSITDGDNFGMTFTAPATWTKVTIPLDAEVLTQRGYGAASTFTKNAIAALQWASNANGALDIQIDNVQFLSSVPMSPTNTPPVPTSTFTRTPVPPTATFTKTNTAVAPTGTFTRTPVPPTSTFTMTNTPVPPTATQTKTNTAVAPTSTSSAVPSATNTQIIPVNTATATAVIPSATPTANIPVPTNTNTAVPPTALPTNTNTAVPPTALPTNTNTAVPPTALPTNTNTAVPPTALPTNTNTAVPPTAMPTKTNTPVPPTALPTKTNTPYIPAASATFTPTTGPVIISFKIMLKEADNNNSTNSPHPQFRIVNTGNMPLNLNNVEVRYWFNCDCTGQALQVYVDYADLKSGNSVTAVTSKLNTAIAATTLGNQSHYVSFRFNSGTMPAIIVPPGDHAEVQARFNKSDWSPMLQSNDWSYTNTSNFIDWNKVTGYTNGTLVYGQEPASAASTLKVASVTTYPNPAQQSAGATIKYTINSSGTTALSANEAGITDPSATVVIQMYTVYGRLVWEKKLSGAPYVSTGEHVTQWDGKVMGTSTLAAGLYTLKVSITSNDGTSNGFSRMVLLK